MSCWSTPRARRASRADKTDPVLSTNLKGNRCNWLCGKLCCTMHTAETGRSEARLQNGDKQQNPKCFHTSDSCYGCKNRFEPCVRADGWQPIKLNKRGLKIRLSCYTFVMLMLSHGTAEQPACVSCQGAGNTSTAELSLLLKASQPPPHAPVAR